jgi:uridylate kinase
VTRRVLIKLSGEALLAKGQEFGLDHHACQDVARIIKEIYDTGVQIGLVVGAGNIFRGNLAEAFGFERTAADHIGLLATAINGLALSQVIATLGCKVRVMSARTLDGIVDTYNWMQAKLHMQEGSIVIFVAGTGNPFFTTDTAAALRASEMQCDELIKATKVDGIYSADPLLNPDAILYDKLTFSQALSDNLKVMDGAAIALCRDNRIPIRVVNLFHQHAMFNAAVYGQGGTLVTA